ncbi:MAG: mannose-1-phosphate guanylyltransferase/mannose-6-phosphate isomerase [Candidatus Kaelpia aquatica]|nr:mannose-1-phosphate guanylyltransferase/mannose-6-phosphate isomerase [Candidatus Kaelpia aquatica]
MKIAILAGGSGTRLWPLSRPSYPKQFLKINSEYSFFQNTILRCLNSVKIQDLIISAHKDYKFHVLSDTMKILSKNQGLPHLIFEPQSRNTFSALLGILNYSLNQLGLKEDEVIAILPSDHLISPTDKFYDFLELAQKHAQDNKIVIFGIKPSNSNSGYGYIKTEGENRELLVVKGFIEKPDGDKVETLIADGNCFWNSGMFCFKIATIVREIKKHMPDAAGFLELSWSNFMDKFGELPNISIDNAIMEKTDNATLIPLNGLSWSDIGSFEALYDVMEKDESKNVLLGDVVAEDTEGSFLISEKRLISAVGLKDMLVVETEDAILIAPKSESQKVRNIVQRLKEEKRNEASEHKTHFRPWGSFNILEEGESYKIKHVTVNPKERLSLQLHNNRSEHWVVVKGRAKVVIGEEEKIIEKNESIYVPKKTKHRLENPGDDTLEIIEVQNGSYLGEDDIVRFDDKYKNLR